MRCLLIVVAALALNACASAPAYWVKTWEGATEHRVVYVDSTLERWGHGVQGWTSCDKAARTCTIYIKTNAQNPDCTLIHELRHKDGFDHPEYPRNFGCDTKFLSILR